MISKMALLMTTLFMLTLSIQLSSSKPFILSEATLKEIIKQIRQENTFPMRKPTPWYGNKVGKVVDKILPTNLYTKKLEKVVDKILKSFKEFTEMKVFDPIQIKVQQHRVKVGDSMYYSYPLDKTKNHYILG